MHPLLVALVVTCYNGTEVMYKGSDVVYVTTSIVAQTREGGNEGYIIVPFQYKERCDIGTLQGDHYQCTACSIEQTLTDKKDTNK